MRLKLPVLVIVIALAAIFTGCSKTPQNPLVGKWILSEEGKMKDSSALIFSVENGIPVFHDNTLRSQPFSGNWKESESQKIVITYVKEKEYTIDSMVLSNKASGGQINYYHEGDRISSTDGKGLHPEETEENIQIITLEDRNLELVYRDKNYVYLKEAEASRGISFMSVIRGIMGLMFLILIAWVFSGNRKRIDWALVGKGLALQIVIAILVLKVPFIESAFTVVSSLFVTVIGCTNDGVNFLFGQLGIGVVQAPLVTFAIKVLPTIIFFSALMSALYYLGILQKVVFVFAWVMKKTMRLSGAESLVTAGNIFLGQTEAPLLVKPYLMGMTKSEIMCLMTGGMATIAGGVLAAYVGFLGGEDPVQQAFFAKHLLTASIISAPAAIVASKILVPETEEFNKDLKVNKDKIGSNLLEAISNGTSDGLKLAVNVGAMLLVFIALTTLLNYFLHWTGDVTGLNETIVENTRYKEGLSFQFILGYIGAPVVWMMGVEGQDMIAVGELLGQKTVLNEFVAYPTLGEMNRAGELSEKSVIIATYMLCGFANFASIGIQIGGIGSLIPSRKGLLSQLGMKALLGGTLASLFTAAVVGMLY